MRSNQDQVKVNKNTNCKFDVAHSSDDAHHRRGLTVSATCRHCFGAEMTSESPSRDVNHVPVDIRFKAPPPHNILINSQSQNWGLKAKERKWKNKSWKYNVTNKHDFLFDWKFRCIVIWHFQFVLIFLNNFQYFYQVKFFFQIFNFSYTSTIFTFDFKTVFNF